MDKNKVILGISGGIDSAAAAILLREKGMEVYALYFDVIKGDHDTDRMNAESICKRLGIPFVYVDISKRFNDLIISSFIQSYKNGRTPMPCMICNPYIKWWILREYADSLGAYWLATGHYADIALMDDYYYIKRSINTSKDQSYMLSRLDQSILSRAVFPLSDFSSKTMVRDFVAFKGFELLKRANESQDICFVDKDYRTFLYERGIESKKGDFIDEQGNVLGKHNGIHKYTVGQGKGFGMGFNKKVYVRSIDPDTGNIVLCENDGLFTSSIIIDVCSFAKYGEIDYVPEEYSGRVFDVKIRYSAAFAKAKLVALSESGKAKLLFECPQRAPAPGQYAVFYANDLVIGCGIIS